MRLNLGSGPHPTPVGWTSVDIDPQYSPDFVADVLDLPFPAASVEAIYAGHVLEHLPLPKVTEALREWRRLLQVGGTLMIVGPDIDRAIAGNEPAWLLQQIIAHGKPPAGHAWTCSTIVLSHLLTEAGWHVEEVDVRDVRFPTWPNADHSATWQLALLCQ